MTRLPLLCLFMGIALVFVSSQSQEIEYTSLDKCEEGTWTVTEITLQPQGSDLIITADVGHGHENNGTLRQLQITLSDCNVLLRCSKVSNRTVSDIDCARDDLADIDENACDLAQALAEWELETGNFTMQQGSSDPLDLCFYFNGESVNITFL